LIILDNSVLSAYARISKLNNIHEIFKEVIIPAAVFDEYTTGKNNEELPTWIKILPLNEKEMHEATKLNLGPGESQAMILALRGKSLLGMDDKLARETAEKLGLEVIGSIGILKIAYETCLIENKIKLKHTLNKLAEDLYIEDWLYDWTLEASKPNDFMKLKQSV